MGEVHLINQEVQSSEMQQVVSQDSLATSKSLRTPIQQVEVKQPRYLQVQRKKTVPKITYRKWSESDSVYFNLKPADGRDLYWGKNVSDVSHVELVEAPNEVEERIEVDTGEQAKQIPVIVQESKPAVLRKASPFEDSKDWLSGFIILALIIAGVVKLTAGKYLSDLFSSVRFQQSASKLFSTANLQNEKPSWALNVLFFLSTSMLIFEFAHIGGKSPEQLSDPVFFMIVIAGIIGYFSLKTILYRFVAFVFDSEQATKEYLFNANMLSKVFGLACLPIVSIVPFVDNLTAGFLIKAGIVLFILMYIIQLLRGAKIILYSPLSIFYMFLYFCALEILPLSILIKVMIY